MMASKVNSRLPEQVLFEVLGSPFTDQRRSPTEKEADEYFDIAFENRVALWFLERCREEGVPLSEAAACNHAHLEERRIKTEAVVARLAKVLNEAAPGKWVLFKSIKPFPSTPNDTDWFPFSRKDHQRLVNHLLENGYVFLEKAPLQTTLIDEGGLGVTDSDKRGGVYYIDCYQIPGADYFVYLDPSKLKRHLVGKQVAGEVVPALDAAAELTAIVFHNVFPERTYSVESFYLILHYIYDLVRSGGVEDFSKTVRENHIERAVSANLSVTEALHKKHFNSVPAVLSQLLEEFPQERMEGSLVGSAGFGLPYNFSVACFWRTFLGKLRDPVSLRSAFVQLAHMLNPVFFADVMLLVWRRTRPGGVYKQM